MKLSAYAKQKGITYKTAWTWWKNGYLKGEQFPSGTILVEESKQTRVGTCGCFDLTLHPGHLDYLKKSKDLGDFLTVLLNTDQWIRENKREPIIPQEHRKLMLESLSFVDQVIIFDTDEEKDNLISEMRFDIWTKASKNNEYSDKSKIIETPTVEKYGGRVIIIPAIYTYSTSEIIQKIKEV